MPGAAAPEDARPGRREPGEVGADHLLGRAGLGVQLGVGVGELDPAPWCVERGLADPGRVRSAGPRNRQCVGHAARVGAGRAADVIGCSDGMTTFCRVFCRVSLAFRTRPGTDRRSRASRAGIPWPSGSFANMRLGVIDVGSNTVHLLVVDAHAGARPIPATSHKVELRLAEHLDDGGRISDKGAKALVGFVASCTEIAEDQGVEDMIAFATSAIREAPNGDAVLARVRAETGVDLQRPARRRGGAADVPGRAPLVRLVGGRAAGARHRRRLAGDGGRDRRGAGRRRLDPAGGRAGDARLAHRRPAVGGRRPRRPPLRARGGGEGGPRPDARRAVRLRGRLQQDVPVAGPGVRGGAQRARARTCRGTWTMRTCGTSCPSWPG